MGSCESENVSCSVVSDSETPRTATRQEEQDRFLCPWDSPGKNTEMGCHSPLQGIFLTQESTQAPTVQAD